jgi:hypothetical protein
VIPLEEAEWYGLDLNAACRKQQDIEDNMAPRPLKYIFEDQLKKELEVDTAPKIQEMFPIMNEKTLSHEDKPIVYRI